MGAESDRIETCTPPPERGPAPIEGGLTTASRRRQAAKNARNQRRAKGWAPPVVRRSKREGRPPHGTGGCGGATLACTDHTGKLSKMARERNDHSARWLKTKWQPYLCKAGWRVVGQFRSTTAPTARCSNSRRRTKKGARTGAPIKKAPERAPQYKETPGRATSGSARRPCWPAPCGRRRPCA
jgi:hypothetical protein